MNDQQIIKKTLHKISIHNLNEETRLFQLIDIPFISIPFKKEPIVVGRKKIRLYLDLFNQSYPLWAESNDKTKADFISDIFKCICTENDLKQLKSFKIITKKSIITMQNENVKTIKRLRWRSRENHNRNYIHFQN